MQLIHHKKIKCNDTNGSLAENLTPCILSTTQVKTFYVTLLNASLHNYVDRLKI